LGDNHRRWLAGYGQPIRKEPTKAVDYDNEPLKSLENPGTSKLWVTGVRSGRVVWFLYARRMTTAGQFITDLQAEQRIGNVSSETEQHLKHEFRKLGRDASGPSLAAAVDTEINRLERQAATLRRLSDDLLSVG